MVNSPKRNRTQSIFDQVQLNAGSTTKVPFLFTVGSLKTVPVSGGFEYDGNRWYGTLNSTIRKTMAFLDDIPYYPRTIEYYGKRSNNIGKSYNNGDGYSGNCANYSLNLSNNVSGTKTASNQFTRSSGTYGVDVWKDKYLLLQNGTNSQILKAKSNTTTVITFYEDILFSPTTLVELSSQPSYVTADKYIDTTFSGTTFKDACFDGVNLWLIPEDTEQNVYKVNMFTYEVTKISYTQQFNSWVCLVFDGNHIWCINQIGQSHMKINILTNEKTFVSNSVQGLKTAIFDGRYIWCFGLNSQVFTYTKTDLSGTVTTYNNATMDSRVVDYLVCVPSLNNKIYVVSHGFFNNILYVDILNTFSNTWQQNVLAYNSGGSMSIRNCIFDGMNIHIFHQDGSGTGLTFFNIYNLYSYRPYSLTSGLPTYYNCFDGSHLVLSGTSGYFTTLYFYDPNFAVNTTLAFNVLFTNTWKIGSSSKFLYTDIGLIQWGGSIISKGVLPKQGSIRYDCNSDENKTVIENGLRLKWKPISFDYLTELRDYGHWVDTSASRTITLPDATLCKNQSFRYKDDTGNANTNNTTFNTLNSQTIDGNSTYTANSNWYNLTFTSNGTNWRLT